MVMTDKKAISIFVVVVAVIALLITLFSWAKPMTMGDKDDVNDIETILSAKENADVDVISIGDLGSYKDTDYQFVKYTTTKDSVTTEKGVMIEVEKKFLNYQCKGVLEP
jgi:hypothetical protein